LTALVDPRREEHLGDGLLIAVSGSVQRRRSPMRVPILGVDVRAVVQQEPHHGDMPFPGGAMERRRPIPIARIDQCGVLLQEITHEVGVATPGRANDALVGPPSI
jgi:hypothetical protein